jgi:hypothetical protein
MTSTTLDRPRTLTRALARWLVTFAGFPLGGLAAILVTGPVDSTASAAAGGALTGAVLGGVQAWGLRMRGREAVAWVVATAAGLAAGLAVGATLVGFQTGTGDLAVQGAVSGLTVGASQALLLRSRPGALAWPVYLATAWTIGWLVTVSAGVRVEEQFTVFGSAGALTVTCLTCVLPVLRSRGNAVPR